MIHFVYMHVLFNELVLDSLIDDSRSNVSMLFICHFEVFMYTYLST